MDFDRLDEIAAHLMKSRQAHTMRETGSVYYHGTRTARGILTLRKAVLPEDNDHDDILRAAAMFHDVGKGIEPHNEYGALLAKEALKNEVTPFELNEIERIIYAHCLRSPGSGEHDNWCMLLQDADLLDHFGVYEIWMNVNYYAYTHEGIDEQVVFYRDELENFLDEHAKLLNFDVSKRIFAEKAEFERAYAKRLFVEARGDYIGFE